MKYYALIALLAVAVLVLIGCTGCDSNPGNTTVDLSTDRTLLCNELGWVAQEDDYVVRNWEGEKIVDAFRIEDFTANNGTLQGALIDDDTTNYEIDKGTVTFENNEVTIDFQNYGPYTIRITANSEDPQPVLSLTALSDDAPIDKMYFSLSGGDA